MLGVDVGGTFTDIVKVQNGSIFVAKVATNSRKPETAIIEGVRRLGVEGSNVLNHASTHGLNSVITRRLRKVAFLTTEGHRDMLDAGRGWRPLEAQTNANWRRSFGDAARPLVPRYLRRGIEERILADGSVLIELDEEQAKAQLGVLKRCGVEGVAVCLLNAYVNPVHERRVQELARGILGEVPVVISSDTSPLAKEYTRASTTVVDVLMKLIYAGYACDLVSGLQGLGFHGEVNFADCAATLIPSERALDQAFRLVFAGPAAGTVSCVRFGGLLGDGELVCCDVGGTSADISLVIGGRPFVNSTFELEHDLVINALSIEVASVGAGGGSVVSITSSGEVAVGPASAGSEPGPACYSRGGKVPTLTDACLLMGIIDSHRFAGGAMQLDPEKAQWAFEQLDSRADWQEIVRYAFRIAANNVAEEITNIAIRHGIDIREFSIVAYGAAGPMLLPAALETLKARRIIVPPYPGAFSALGLLSADQVYSESRSAYVVLERDAAGQMDAVFREIEVGMRGRLPAGASPLVRRSFDGRLLGQTWETPFIKVPSGRITEDSISEMIESFHEEYKRRFGHRFDHLPVQGVTYRVELILPSAKVEYDQIPIGSRRPDPKRKGMLRFLSEQPLEVLEYERGELRAGDRILGPAIIRESFSTTLVGPAQQAMVGSYGELIIERGKESQ